MKGNGVMKDVYYIRHRVTKEIAFVELGSQYDQSVWELICPVPTDFSS